MFYTDRVTWHRSRCQHPAPSSHSWSWSWSGPGLKLTDIWSPNLLISHAATVPRCHGTPGLGRKVWNATLWSVCTVYTANPRTHIRELAQRHTQHGVPLMVHNSTWGRDEAFECNVRFSNADFIKMLLQSITKLLKYNKLLNIILCISL